MSASESISIDEAREFRESLPKAVQRALIDRLYDWSTWARPEQQWPESNPRLIVIQAGRGTGKTRTALEWIRQHTDAGVWRTVLCVGATWPDVIGTMVEGTAEAPGLLRLWPPWQKAVYTGGTGGSDPHVTTHNGARIILRSAERPDRIRGINADGAWADEVDHWSPPKMTQREAFGVLELAVRTGPMPSIIATSTPKPSRLIADLRKREGVHVVTGSTYDNKDNLSPVALRSIEALYEGTRWGRQELYGELLEDVEGALVTREMIEGGRVASVERESLKRIVVGVDPSGSEDKDLQGIVTAGLGHDGHVYVLADDSCSLSPEGWGRRAVQSYQRERADCIVVEKNYGGDMVVSTIRTVDKTVRVKPVTATRGKVVRFEPVAALYEQGRIHHVGSHPELEEQVMAFTTRGYEGTDSPDRADAFVWAVTDLLASAGPARVRAVTGLY